MKRQVYFCDKWSGNYKEPIDLMSLEEAKKSHNAKKTYTVLIGSETEPSCVLDVGDKFVFVGFLDNKLREMLSYSFQEVESGKLFLKNSIHREFQGDTDEIKFASEYFFSPEGVVTVKNSTMRANGLRDVEKFDVRVDISGCYENYPEFGEYDNFIVVERDIQHGRADKFT